jgi:hypothetical protein
MLNSTAQALQEVIFEHLAIRTFTWSRAVARLQVKVLIAISSYCEECPLTGFFNTSSVASVRADSSATG